ncbi:MAG: IS110 family transposase [Hadesarchaea archaeon]|nr:IS110 family transposase [Hadesarchaea archaeon]
MKYVGLDVHKETVHGTVMDERGRVLKRGGFFNTQGGFERFFQGIGDAEVAMEAGYGWQPPYELLEGMGYRTKLAHPYETQIIAKSKIKTDATDSEKLAQLLRTGFLPEAYAPPKRVRELRDLLYRRTYLVKTQTKFKNKIQAELAKRWIKPERRELFTGPGKSYLRSLHIDAVEDYLAALEALEERIKGLSKRIMYLAGENANAKLLMTIPGVGYFSAMVIIAEIGDINRFGSSEELCSYAGIVPSTRESGGGVRHGSITKRGRKLMRWVLEQCVWVHLKYNTKLTRYWERLARTKGKKAAATATARKLLKVMYWMLKRRGEYRPEGVRIGKYR